MTGYTVHTGTSKKFVSGWDRIFSGEGEKQDAEKTPSASGKKKKKSKAKKKSQ